MHKVISSISNEQIKNVRKLKSKKERELTGNFYVEGLRLISEAIYRKYPIETLIYCPSLLVSSHGQELILRAERESYEIWEVNEEVFRSLAMKEGPQGIAAVIKQCWYFLDEINKSPGIWVGLESAQDPGNVGSILRTLDAVGGKGIILLNSSVDVHHPTSVRASMGAIFTQRLISCGQDKFIDWKKQSGIFLIGSLCDAEKKYTDIRYPPEMVLMLGSEQKGLNNLISRECDELVKVPMKGSVDSLNLACAASIILYEIFNQAN